jgi:hypothetical protein
VKPLLRERLSSYSFLAHSFRQGWRSLLVGWISHSAFRAPQHGLTYSKILLILNYRSRHHAIIHGQSPFGFARLVYFSGQLTKYVLKQLAAGVPDTRVLEKLGYRRNPCQRPRPG